MRRAIALAVLCAVLLAGCGRGAHRTGSGAQPAPATTSTATSPPVVKVENSAPGGSVDTQLKSVDDLLNELDNQVNTDGQTAPDAD